MRTCRFVCLATVVGLALATPVSGQVISSDNFDSYAVGSGIGGQGPWTTWDGSALADTTVSDVQSFSGDNSLLVAGAADIVQTFAALTSGFVIVSAMTYVPSTQTGEMYFILLNTYASGGPYNWSVQLQFSASTGLVADQGGSLGGPPGGTTMTLITDAWVPVRVEIDLDNNLHNIYYNNLPLRLGDIFSGAAIALGAMDLYSDGSSESYMDDILVEIPSCLPVSGLSCTLNCLTGGVGLTWTNGSIYSAIDISRDGTSIATLAGTASSYTDPAPGPNFHTYVVTPSCGATSAAVTACTINTTTTLTGDNIIWAAEETSQIDSVAALAAAFTAIGESYNIVDSITALPCGSVLTSDQIIWSLVGTFPSNHPLSAAEGDALVAHITSGGAVYHEGPDTWGFDVATSFDGYDGIDSAIVVDGDDTFVSMIGTDYGPLLVGGLASTYSQDQAGNDWTDQLATTLGDAAGLNSGVVWNEDGTGGGYATGVFYDTDAPNGKVHCQSWEFGGYDGDRNLLAQRYVDALSASGPPVPQFKRGDSNSDGSFNIADAVSTLSALFVPGSPAASCADAADANSDNTVNIADAVYALSALFVPGAPPPGAPFPGCGSDPDSDVVLACVSYPPC
ncbi:MAG: hypothetical protein ACKVX7_18355 [Planctomycetota bacterium]